MIRCTSLATIVWVLVSTGLLYASQRSPVPFADTTQVKWTYQGPQTEPIPTILFTTENSPVVLTRFTPYQRPEGDGMYANDRYSLDVIRLDPETMRQLLVALYTTNLDGTTGDPIVSEIIVWTDHQGETGNEYLLDVDDLRQLFPAVSKLVGEAGATTLQDWGCALGLFPNSAACR